MIYFLPLFKSKILGRHRTSICKSCSSCNSSFLWEYWTHIEHTFRQTYLNGLLRIPTMLVCCPRQCMFEHMCRHLCWRSRRWYRRIGGRHRSWNHLEAVPQCWNRINRHQPCSSLGFQTHLLIQIHHHRRTLTLLTFEFCCLVCPSQWIRKYCLYS